MSDLILSPGGRLYGALPQVPNLKDFKLSRVLSSSLPLPPKTNNRAFRGPIKDQGQEGACVAFSATSQLEYDERRYKGRKVVFSPAFVYYEGRKLDGTLDEGDCGLQPRTGAVVLNRLGCCTEAQMPYIAGNYTVAPTPAQVQEASVYSKNAFHAVVPLPDMKACLTSGYGFTVAFAVFSSFEGKDVADTGFMPLPSSSEQFLGGHQAFVLDFDDSLTCPYWPSPGGLIVQNSYGKDWGVGGLFYISYSMTGDIYACWTQHLGPPWVPKSSN